MSVATVIKSINLIPSGLPLKLFCDQDDKSTASGGRMFMLSLQKNGTNYIPQTGAIISVEGTKPNGSTFLHQLNSIASVVYLPLFEDMTDIAGNVEMQIVVKEGNNRTASQLIILDVQRSAYNDNTGI